MPVNRYRVDYKYADGKTDYVMIAASSPSAAKKEAIEGSTRPIKAIKITKIGDEASEQKEIASGSRFAKTGDWYVIEYDATPREGDRKNKKPRQKVVARNMSYERASQLAKLKNANTNSSRFRPYHG